MKVTAVGILTLLLVAVIPRGLAVDPPALAGHHRTGAQ